MIAPFLFVEPFSRLVLRLVAAANLLFAASFLLAIALAAGPARAETSSCTGQNLLDSIAASDPAAFARIEAEADKVHNGQGGLWLVEKDGVAPSYLFGTMHVTDPRVVELPPEAKAAFDAADTVVVETTEVLDQAQVFAAMAGRPDLMMFTDGSTLFSQLEPNVEAELRDLLAARGITPAAVQKMKPWMLAATVALPACEMARKAAGMPFLDIKLANDAKAAGKELAGLETLVGQLDAMASLSMDFHMDGLIATLRLGNHLDDMFETMIVLYANGEIGKLWPLFQEVLPVGPDSANAYAEFEEAMITIRNRTMAQNAKPIIDRGSAFVAVGALHLPRGDGLVELLRQAGYRVTRAD